MFFEYFLSFGLFFLSAVAIVALFLVLYALVTPYDDYRLIFEEHNTAAALGFGGAIVGLCIVLHSALIHSVSYVDFLIWAIVAMVIQLLFAFGVTRLKGKLSFEASIVKGDISVGTLMALLSVAIGLLNAGSMSY